nr:unnamed protein product [Callosobruchus chinensis]
MIKLWTK